MSNAATLEPGTYQHYKGNQYDVIGIGTDTETGAIVVIYRPLYDCDVAYWVRPYAMFTEDVKIGEILVPRFKKIN